MTSQNIFSEKIVVVAKSDTADYRTIGEAVENVEPQTQILVQPGIYRESIVIDKPLEIVGDGKISDIIIEAANASCIVMQTESSLVRGLTLRNINREKEHMHCAVNISQGKLVLEDCNITSDSSGCVLITGSTTNPEIRRCRIYDGKTGGILIINNGLGIIKDCDIYGNTYAGVGIGNGGNPRIGNCRVYDGKGNGIYITKNGLGTIEDCDIYGNTYAGVFIDNGGNPRISQCRIYDGKQNGILIKDNGLGIIEDCDIYSNAYRGVFIDKGSNPRISQCRIYDGKQNGISIKDNGLGIIEDCDIYSNTYPGVFIDKGSNPRISQCRIYDGKGNGICIAENGLGIIEDCDIYGNVSPGVYINKGGNPRISRCRIYDGKGNGISIKDKGLGIIEDCEIYRNAGMGVGISDKGNPTLRRCHIHHGKKEAIWIYKLGQGNIQNCKIESHPFPGIKIAQGCQPTFRRCTLKTTKPPYLGLAIILGICVASPIAFVGLTFASKLGILLAAIAPVYFQFSRKGFGQGFIIKTICFTVFFGSVLGSLFISGTSLWGLLSLTAWGSYLIRFIFFPVFEQAKLMSNYDVKKLSSNKR